MASTVAADGLDHTYRRWLPAYSIVIEAVTTLLLTIRMISRINRIGGRLGMDDALIVGAWLCGFAMTTLIIYCEFLHNCGVERTTKR
jgi:hypothetical protein